MQPVLSMVHLSPFSRKSIGGAPRISPDVDGSLLDAQSIGGAPTISPDVDGSLLDAQSIGGAPTISPDVDGSLLDAQLVHPSSVNGSANKIKLK